MRNRISDAFENDPNGEVLERATNDSVRLDEFRRHFAVIDLKAYEYFGDLLRKIETARAAATAHEPGRP